MEVAATTGDSGAPSPQWIRRNTRILDALEDLLLHTALRDLGVEDIARAAGITRTRFYVYYKSKYEAYAAVLARLAESVIDTYVYPGSWFHRPPEMRPRESLMQTFFTVLPLWWERRGVIREACDMWTVLPENSNHWRALMSEFCKHASRAIERERELGVAPPGIDADELATFLMWQMERIFYLGVLDNRAPDQKMADVGVGIWMRTIYLTDDPDP